MTSIQIYYNLDWLRDQRNLPEPGTIVISPDPQNRCGKSTWGVSIYDDGTFGGDMTHLGLFWHIEDALRFAEAIEKTEPHPEFLISRYRFPAKGFDKRCRLNGCTTGGSKYCNPCKYSEYPGGKSRYSGFHHLAGTRCLNNPDLSFADLVKS